MDDIENDDQRPQEGHDQADDDTWEVRFVKPFHIVVRVPNKSHRDDAKHLKETSSSKNF